MKLGAAIFTSPSEDALRVDVETKEIPHVELLTYTFDEVGPNSATVSLSWEKKQIPFTIETDVTGNVMAEIRQQLQTFPGFVRQTWEHGRWVCVEQWGRFGRSTGLGRMQPLKGNFSVRRTLIT